MVQSQPNLSVTVVDNHDTQPLQALEAPVEPWFKPIALCINFTETRRFSLCFYPDLFGATYKDYGNDGNEHKIFLEK